MGKQRILVVSAHPDDEILGCGGAMAQHTSRGDKVHVLILGEGVTSRADRRNAAADRKALAALRAQAGKAARIVGATVELHSLPDNRFDSVDMLDIIKIVEQVKKRFKPDTVLTHHGGDLNIDHRRTLQAVLTACRPMRGETVRTILSFEVPSSTEWNAPSAACCFLPNCYVDISRTLAKKLKAMAAYRNELRSAPHPRSLQALKTLASQRGSQVGMAAAEAFMVIRKLL